MPHMARRLATALTLALAATVSTAADWPADWTVRFQGEDTAGPLSGTLTMSLRPDNWSYENIYQVRDDGTREHRIQTPYNESALVLTTTGTAAPESLPLFSTGVTALLMPDGTSRLEINWGTWAMRREVHDWYGVTGPDVIVSGSLELASSTDELYTKSMSTWQNLTSAKGTLHRSESSYIFRDKYTSTEVPGFTNHRSFTLTSVSSVPEPEAVTLGLFGMAGALVAARARGRRAG